MVSRVLTNFPLLASPALSYRRRWTHPHALNRKKLILSIHSYWVQRKCRTVFIGNWYPVV